VTTSFASKQKKTHFFVLIKAIEIHLSRNDALAVFADRVSPAGQNMWQLVSTSACDTPMSERFESVERNKNLIKK